jgi:hypothetical protein
MATGIVAHTVATDEARAIVAELEPVDPDVAEAERLYKAWVHDPSGSPFAQDAILYGLKRGRELEREGK